MYIFNGRDVMIWVNEHKTANGNFKTYAISISTKNKDTGEYTNKSMKVKFAKSVEVPENLQSKDKFDFEGFPTLETYTDKDGKQQVQIIVMITDAKFNGEQLGFDEMTQAEDDIPF